MQEVSKEAEQKRLKQLLKFQNIKEKKKLKYSRSVCPSVSKSRQQNKFRVQVSFTQAASWKEAGWIWERQIKVLHPPCFSCIQGGPLSAVNPQTPDESTRCMPCYQIHTWKSAHMDRRDRDQTCSGAAEAIMFWREAAQSRRTGGCFTGRESPSGPCFPEVCVWILQVLTAQTWTTETWTCWTRPERSTRCPAATQRQDDQWECVQTENRRGKKMTS